MRTVGYVHIEGVGTWTRSRSAGCASPDCTALISASPRRAARDGAHPARRAGRGRARRDRRRRVGDRERCGRRSPARPDGGRGHRAPTARRHRAAAAGRTRPVVARRGRRRVPLGRPGSGPAAGGRGAPAEARSRSTSTSRAAVAARGLLGSIGQARPACADVRARRRHRRTSRRRVRAAVGGAPPPVPVAHVRARGLPPRRRSRTGR